MTLKRETIAVLGAIVLTPLFFHPIMPSALAAPQPSTVALSGAVKVGMTQAQILRLLGQPNQKHGQFWVWLNRKSPYGVTFKNGKVLRHGALQG
jgi:hypothetical protein